MTTRRQFLMPLVLVPVAGWAVWASGAQEPEHPPGPFHLPLDASTALWHSLSAVRFTGPASEPVFPDAVTALDGQPVTLRGYMVPLEDGAAHRRFILAANPVWCAACQNPRPASMVEVRTRAPVPPLRDAVTLTGTLRLKPHEGLFYRLDRADVWMA